MTIFIRLQGGLGNQLFQICAAHQVLKATERTVGLDVSWFTNNQLDTPRSLEVQLSSFNFPIVDFSPFQSMVLMRLGSPFVVHESDSADPSKNVGRFTRLIVGYFQSLDLAIEEIDAVSSLILQKSKPALSQGKYIAVHSRLGDYLSNTSTSEFHGVTSPMWLLQEAEGLCHDLNIDTIVVFTDSVAEFQVSTRNFQSSRNIHFDNSETAWDILLSIASANGIVMSNSSLSWWAAFTSTYIHKNDVPVVFPLPWLARQSSMDQTLFSKHWIPKNRELF
jgi:hypothetical protein